MTSVPILFLNTLWEEENMQSQKFSKNVLASTVAAVMLPAFSLGFSTSAQAEVESSLTLSSMYLWRGLNVSGTSPAVSGSLDYSHSSGLYVGTWMSSEGATGSHEVDLYGGYGGSAGDISYGLGIAGYYYPEMAGAPTSSDIYEVILSGGFKDYGATLFVNAEPDDFDDYMYLSLDGPIAGAFSAHIGMTMTGDDSGKYTDFNVSYAATENLTWTVSYATGDAIAEDGPSDDPMVVISYSVPLK